MVKSIVKEEHVEPLPGVTLHLKAKVVGHRSAEVVWWGGAPFADALRAGPVDLLGTVRDNVWNGWSRTQLTVIDARRSG